MAGRRDGRPHYLWEVMGEVERTHPGLGRFVGMQLVAARAKTTLLAISPAGAGKSTASFAVSKAVGKSKLFDSLTRSGLAKLQEDFNNYEGVVMIDDLGKVENDYSRIATMTTLVELTYSHFIEKHSAQIHISINNFQGTAIVNCQPVVLKSVVASGEWEATIADKSIRYYHLVRPQVPTEDELKISPLPFGDIEQVAAPSKDLAGYGELRETGLVQWSRGRVDMHLSSLLRATACLDDRNEVTEADTAVLAYITMPMRTERYIMSKDGLEDGRSLNNELVGFFVEWGSHGAFTLEDLCEDYHVSSATAYKVLNRNQKFWVPTKDKPVRFAPSHLARSHDGKRSMLDVLKDIGIDYCPDVDPE